LSSTALVFNGACFQRRLFSTATVATALAADYITYSHIGVACYRATDSIHTTDTLAHDVAGRIGDCADSLTSGLEKMADRAVNLTEKTRGAGPSSLDIISACGTTILAGSLAGTVTTVDH
jgi:hypothetical protein